MELSKIHIGCKYKTAKGEAVVTWFDCSKKTFFLENLIDHNSYELGENQIFEKIPDFNLIKKK